MTKLEELEKKVADTKAAADTADADVTAADAIASYATAAYAHAWDDPWDDVISPALDAEAAKAAKAAEAAEVAYAAAYTACADAAGAHLQAMDELKNYLKERDMEAMIKKALKLWDKEKDNE